MSLLMKMFLSTARFHFQSWHRKFKRLNYVWINHLWLWFKSSKIFQNYSAICSYLPDPDIFKSGLNHLSLLKLRLPGQYFFTLNSFDRPNAISLAKHKHTSVKTTITVHHVGHLRTSFQIQLETPDLDVVVDPVMFMLRFWEISKLPVFSLSVSFP